MFRSLLRVKVAEKAHREARRITGVEIADETGIRQPTVSSWMQESRTFQQLDAALLGRLADFVGCDPLDLIEFVSNGND